MKVKVKQIQSPFITAGVLITGAILFNWELITLGYLYMVDAALLLIVLVFVLVSKRFLEGKQAKFLEWFIIILGYLAYGSVFAGFLVLFYHYFIGPYLIISPVDIRLLISVAIIAISHIGALFVAIYSNKREIKRFEELILQRIVTSGFMIFLLLSIYGYAGFLIEYAFQFPVIIIFILVKLAVDLYMTSGSIRVKRKIPA